MTRNNVKMKLFGKISAIVFGTVIYGAVLTFCTAESVYADENISLEYQDESGEPKTCDSCQKITGETEVLYAGFYCVDVNTSLSGRIQVEGTNDNPTCLILCNGATFTAEKGIQVSEGSCLRIYSQSTDDSMGELVSIGDDKFAGIGGGDSGANGTIEIYGGKITATGGINAAGIGGGNGGAGGNISINGGKVNAHGGAFAAGIGGGCNGAAGAITINGGQIEASSKKR